MARLPAGKRRGMADGVRATVALLGDRARPDLNWAATVTGETEIEVARVLEQIGEELEDEAEIARILESTGRTYYAQFPAPLELYVITRLLRPEHVVESGVSSGLSTAHILMALGRNGTGTLHSVDLPEYQKAERRSRGEQSWSIPKGKDSGWAIPDRLKARWDLRQGRSEDLLPSLLRELPRVDLFCHDSPWTAEHLAFELHAIGPRLGPGSVVVADNSDHNPEAVEALAREFATRVCRRRNSSLVGIRIP